MPAIAASVGAALPGGLEAVDADWMSRCLAANGIDARVSRLSSRPVGTGQMAHCERLSLTYSEINPAAPATLIVKVPSPHERSRKSGAGSSGYYAREVGFYQHLASSALIRTPKCYCAWHDPERGAFMLILEDLSPAKQGDQLEGVTIEQAADVLREAAKLHASHWSDDRIDELPWVSGSRSATSRAPAKDSFTRIWRGFTQRYGDRIDPEARAIGERFLAVFDVYQNGCGGPRCLTHNDFRPDNMMFATGAGQPPVTVLDWQTLGFGHGASDVSYFLAGSLSPKLRREHENDLLNLYFAELQRLGVADYTRPEFMHAIAWNSFYLFVAATIGAMVVQQTERGDEMFLVMLHGAADQIAALDALALVETLA